MRHDPMEPVWFDFGNLGYPGWTPVTLLEMRLMLQGAQNLVQDNPREAVDFMIQRTRQTLFDAATQVGVNDHWVSQALLVTAMTGLLGYEIPEVRYFDD
jgi:hypothetical protein